MRPCDMNPLNDALFKYIFGGPEHKTVTLSFINAVLGLEGTHAFVDLQFVDRVHTPRVLTGKETVLDLFCIASDGTQVNIEVQVRDQRNIVRRTLFSGRNAIKEP